MTKSKTLLLLSVTVLLLSACTLSKPPSYDLPTADDVFPGREITVGAGENLYVIAQKNHVRMTEIIVVNKMQPPYRVQPGDHIYLPARDPYTAPRPRPAPRDPVRSDAVTSVPLDAPITTSTLPAKTAPMPLAKPEEITSPPISSRVEEDPTVTTRTGQSNLRTQAHPRSATDVPEWDVARLREQIETKGSTASIEERAPQKNITTPTPAPRRTVSDLSGDVPTFAWPVRGTIVSAFGPKGNGRDNDGLNIAAPRSAPVKASAPGVVAYAGNEMKGFGNLVLIRHDKGWVTAYAHLDRILVGRDVNVAEGDMIGTVGATGGVKSPQLHFEARRDGKPVDPELVLK